jgi:methionyl-tRNA synthetase
MLSKYSNNKIIKGSTNYSENDEKMIAKIKETHNLIINNINKFELNEVCKNILDLSFDANKYVEETKP